MVPGAGARGDPGNATSRFGHPPAMVRSGTLASAAPGALHGSRVMRVLPLALLLVLVAAAPAAADSLVYVKDSNVWSARPTGPSSAG